MKQETLVFNTVKNSVRNAMKCQKIARKCWKIARKCQKMSENSENIRKCQEMLENAGNR